MPIGTFAGLVLVKFLMILVVSTHSLASENTIPHLGVTETGHPYKGDADAPVTLVEYSDYLCPFCARHHRGTYTELIEKYVKAGKLKIEFRHFPIAVLHPTAAKGHEAAACAMQQSAEGFWNYHNALFTQQADWNRLPDPSEFLTELATTLGLNDEDWVHCFTSSAQQKLVEDDVAEGKSKLFNGTPTFQISLDDDQDAPYTISGARSIEYFSNVIDALLAGEKPPTPPERKKTELPTWAKPDALAVDPDRPGFTVSGDPTHGSSDALLTIVEFTDYQCPACAKHFIETQPAIEEQLIVSGKVRWVSKHLPFPEHENSLIAAAAVECAAFQGRFVEMKHELFAVQKRWASIDNPDLAFADIAEDLQMDREEFATCLSSRDSLDGVVPDIFEGLSLSRATPLFVILTSDDIRLIRGHIHSEKFINHISTYLNTIKPDRTNTSENSS